MDCLKIKQQNTFDNYLSKSEQYTEYKSSASQSCPGGPPALHILYVSLIRHTQFSSCSLH